MFYTETYLELTVRPAQDKDFNVTLTILGQPSHSEHCHTCSFRSYQVVHTLVDGFRQLLKSGGHATLAAPLLHSVGIELFHVWLAPFWPIIEKTWQRHRSLFLTVVADTPEVLNLPWELLQWPDGVLLGLDARVALRRRPSRYPGAIHRPALPPRLTPIFSPLKILYMVSSPTGFDRGDALTTLEAFFREMENHLGHLHRIEVVQVSSATSVALKQYLHQYQPSMVYLTGPTLIRGEQGFFGFEDENGQADILSATEMVKDIFDNGSTPMVPMVIIAGRAAAAPPPVAAVGALCQAFVFQGMDLALAWPNKLSDPFSSAFFRAFLQDGVEGVIVDQAIQRARQTIQPDCERTGYPAWVLPALYARSCRTLP